MTAQELVKEFISELKSDWIELDNLDKARLVFNENKEVMVENEHGALFPVSDLSDFEIEIFSMVI